MASRRKLLAGCLVLLTGCTDTEDDQEADYSLDDLRLSNHRDRPVDVTVTLVPEGANESTMDLSVRLPPDEGIVWDDNPLLDDPGLVTVTVDDGTDETERKEDDWRGDTSDDNRRLVVLVEDDGIQIKQHVS